MNAVKMTGPMLVDACFKTNGCVKAAYTPALATYLRGRCDYEITNAAEYGTPADVRFKGNSDGQKPWLVILVK